jgi:hypothetical protein
MKYMAVVLLTCAASAQTAQPARQAHLRADRLCFVDGWQYSNISQAVAGCGRDGVVVIPPTYDGSETSDGAATNVLDFRRANLTKGLTPVTDFGAHGDAGTANDGSSQNGSGWFESPSAHFVPGQDEGKAIVITGAGPDNASLTTTIRAVKSPSRVLLATPAGFTDSGLTYWYGTENTHAFQAAYDSGQLLFLPAGKFLLTGTVKGWKSLLLTGTGAQSTIIDDVSVFDLHGSGGHFLDNFRLQSATRLTPVSPDAFPTRYPGTPVSLDRIGDGIGYQPELQDLDAWPNVSEQQRAQQIGPAILSTSDGTHIYRITGDLVAVLLFDVQHSEVAMCDFRAGKNWVGGIALWHTPRDGRMNRDDSIHNNQVQYASYSGIIWTAAERVLISHNQTAYDGESGFKNYSSQGDGTYNSSIEVTGNSTQRNHYDGFDLSEDYPHRNTHVASSTFSNNTSSGNDRTGTYGDGLQWKLIDNDFENNGLTGMSVDMSDSVISGNTLRNNNTLHEPNSHQMLVGPGRPSQNNLIERNHIEAPADAGAAIAWSRASTGNKLKDNTASGGAVFRFGVAPAEAENNSDSHGQYPDK